MEMVREQGDKNFKQAWMLFWILSRHTDLSEGASSEETTGGHTKSANSCCHSAQAADAAGQARGEGRRR